MPFIVISGFSMSLYVGSVTNDLIKFLAHFRQYTCVCPDVGDVPVHLNHDVSDIDNFIQLHCSISGDLQNVIPNIGDFSLNIRESSVEFVAGVLRHGLESASRCLFVRQRNPRRNL